MRKKLVFALTAIIILLAVPLVAQEFPSPSGYVNDFAGVISSDTESRISQMADTIERATSVEIAVATVPNLGSYGSIEQYSVDLASDWGIGKEGEDNGMLLLLSLEERRARIEVGYGLEGAFPDGLVGRIMDESMVPYFKNNDFGTGFLKTVEGIAGVIEKEYDIDLSGISQTESRKYTRTSSGSSFSRSPIYVIFVVIFIFGGRFLWPILFLGGMGRRGGRGGFGSFGGGGGFGGFGGGGFGGGGASRGF